ncbi:MAG: glycoside hydrolase family 99-like domain-containing protein [Promicromonosporaceae bacterium]|nr:glycoside hydrolase family 99-like domain-containing protein [Promicromonosporaceae bacterium]
MIDAASRAVLRSGLFDADWYVARYPDVAASGLDPLAHFLTVGESQLRDPSPYFSTRAYRASHRTSLGTETSALLHFLREGHGRGKVPPAVPGPPLPTARQEFVPLGGRTCEGTRTATRAIAFYLPQFHQIPENDTWWGEGFTEWTNVRSSRPLFSGHHQPQVPGELGYYDLADVEVMRSQASLARKYGLNAFCFYFYWFGGKTLLEAPLRNWLEDPSIDFPFLLCWANENWTRRWDGLEHDILIAQQHSPEDDLAFIDHVSPYLRDPRYLRVNGRPVLLVYKPELLPDAAATARRWRDRCRENGVGELHLVFQRSSNTGAPAEYGFDAEAEFPPRSTPNRSIEGPASLGPGPAYRDWEYAANSVGPPSNTHRIYPGAMPSWDNTPRRGKDGSVFLHSSPQKFTTWLTAACRRSLAEAKGEDDALVFINSWNEWAEGAQIEPDARYGYARLESVRLAQALTTPLPPLPTEPTVRVFIDATEALSPEIAWEQVLARFNADTLTVLGRADQVERLRAALPAAVRPDQVSVPRGEQAMVGILDSLAEGSAPSDLVLRLDLSESDPYALVRYGHEARFGRDDGLGLIAALGRRGEREYLAPWREALAARLGLADTGQTPVRSFLVRGEVLGPLSALAFDDSDLISTGARYVPGLGHLLASTLSILTSSFGLRVAGLVPPSAGATGTTAVVITHDMHPHGGERLSLSIGQSLKQLGYCVEFIALGPGELHDQFQAVGPVRRLDLRNDDASAITCLLDEIPRRAGILAIGNCTPTGALSPYLHRSGIDHVIVINEMTTMLRHVKAEAPARAALENARALTFASTVVRDSLARYLGEPIPNAVIRHQGIYLANPHRAGQAQVEARAAIRAAHGIPPSAPVILGLGFAIKIKGIDLFTQAAARVLAENPEAYAVWVGRPGLPELMAEAQAPLAAAGVADRFVFTGFVDDPGLYYAGADLFLMSSREDSFPSTVLEAMDSGVPVIGFDGATGSQELIAASGVLVPNQDTAAMADAALHLLADSAERRRLGDLSRQAVGSPEFTMTGYARHLADLALGQSSS